MWRDLVRGWVFLLIVIALVALGVSLARADLVTVPRACIAVADKYGMSAPEKMERAEIERLLGSADVIAITVLIPAVRRCRAALKVELKK